MHWGGAAVRRFLLPFIVLSVPLGFLAGSLWDGSRRLPSALIGKPAPAFDLPRLDAASPVVSPDALLGHVWLLNVWASWCEPCRHEHALLLEFSRRNIAPVYGLDYKDDPAAAVRSLALAGNPYVASAVDRSGDVGVDYGVSAVPETFVIDRRGVVRYKLAGPLTRAVLDNSILPLLHELQGEMCDE
jgi:cytochrome c biogenesis protein CcmG/thiol:disulfide interchange protein DsbE